jgi:SNF2 family DNA or RNA helicase
MDTNLLYFDQERNRFIFTSNNKNIDQVFAITRSATLQGMVWSIPSTYPDGYVALKDLKALEPTLKATPEALLRINELKQTPTLISNLTILNSCEFDFKVPPFRHQLQAIEHLLHYPAIALLLQQGLGKSYIALTYLAIKQKMLGKKFRALVLTPKIVIPTWYRETQLYTDLNPVLYRGTAKKRQALRTSLLPGGENQDWDVIVSSYGTILPRSQADIKDYKGRLKGTVAKDEEFNFFTKQLPYDVIILDEGHRVKGHGSDRSTAVYTLAQAVENRIILSGTISLGTPLDVYMPYTILNSRVFGTNFWKFRNKYCKFSAWNRHMITGFKNLEHLKTRIDPYTLAMTRDECISLPPRLEETKYYELTQEQQELYNLIATQDTVEVGGKSINTSLAIIKVNKLMQVLSGFLILPLERTDAICNTCPRVVDCVRADLYPWSPECVHPNTCAKPRREYYDLKENPKLELLQGDIEELEEKVIIWVNYQRELAHVRGMLDEQKIPYVLAGQPGCDSEFNDSPEIKVFLGQISQGIGITLNSAAVTIYYNRSLKLEDYLQSMDRNYRIGQKSSVVVRNYICPGSIEESVVTLLNQKEDVKDFIQRRGDCSQCEKSVWCLERSIVPYSDKCMHGATRHKAEKKKKLSLKTIGVQEDDAWNVMD